MLHHHVWVPAYFCTGVSDEHNVSVTWRLPRHTRAADHTLASSAVAVNMCVPAPGHQQRDEGEAWTHTLSCTTQDGCFPSSSSISHPMIHFTDTWVIIGVCSPPLGTEPQVGEGGGGCLPGNAKTGQQVRECKAKRQEWRWRRGWNELNLTAVVGLVQEKLHFHSANESPACERRKQSWLMWKNKRRPGKCMGTRPLKERSERKHIKSWTQMHEVHDGGAKWDGRRTSAP